MNYYLMNKDDRLLSFATTYSMGDTIVTEKERYTDRLPIGFTDISLWIENRNYAKHKDSLKGYLREWGIDNVDGFIAVTHCLGLNDTLWVKPTDSMLHWDQVSLYTNDFSDVMEKTAFGNGLNGIEISSTDLTSPEFVSPGSFAKCWRREKDGIYLYKTTGSLSQGFEPYSEYFASQIAEKFSVPAVRYELTKLNGRLCTRCKMFTTEEIGLVPFAGVFDITRKRYNIPAIIAACDELGCGEEIRQMYLLDSLILNQDRHLGNIGFLFDNHTFDIIGLAPIYDFNVSMLGDLWPEDIRSVDTIDAYMDRNRIKPKASDASFYDVATALGISLPKDVSFVQDEKYRMDDTRFQALSNYIQVNFDRIRYHNHALHRNKKVTAVETSLAEYLSGLNYRIEDGVFTLVLTRSDFVENPYLSKFRTLYGLGTDEKIVVTVSSGTIRCMLEDESGESEVGDEFLGDKKAFLSAVVNVKRNHAP